MRTGVSQMSENPTLMTEPTNFLSDTLAEGNICGGNRYDKSIWDPQGFADPTTALPTGLGTVPTKS